MKTKKRIVKFEKREYAKASKAKPYILRLCPQFDLGLEYLGLSADKTSTKEINSFVESWFERPEKYLKVSDKVRPEVKEGGRFLRFPSVVNPEETARFKFDFQSKDKPGAKIGLIVLMNWDGRLKTYDKGISLIRKYFLPVSTFIFVPAGRKANPKRDYESVSANIGKTVYRTMQDVQDIQYMAKYLKEVKGFEKVGLMTFSLGSQRGIISSINNPKLFDFAIFNLVCHDFTQAIMEGFATQEIATRIEDNIDLCVLEKIWKTISPGAYEKYLTNLPENVRIVSSKYDYVFGPANEQRLVNLIKEKRPDAEVETANLTHYTLGSFPKGYKVMLNNIKFIYKHTALKKCKRSPLFISFDDLDEEDKKNLSKTKYFLYKNWKKMLIGKLCLSLVLFIVLFYFV